MDDGCICRFIYWSERCRDFRDRFNQKCFLAKETDHDDPNRAIKTHNNERKRQQLFGNQRIGNDVYEWDDINIAVISGDTIIDLGNTLLPKDDNIVIVRKGIGRTRILVPLGVAIRLEHATLVGNVLFEEEQFSLKMNKSKSTAVIMMKTLVD